MVKEQANLKLDDIQIFTDFSHRMVDIIFNIKESNLNEILITEEVESAFDTFITKFVSLTQIDLLNARQVFYEKIGYAFLDYKGNFSK